MKWVIASKFWVSGFAAGLALASLSTGRGVAVFVSAAFITAGIGVHLMKRESTPTTTAQESENE